MSRRVHITTELLREIVNDPCQGDVMAVHELLCEAADPFDPDEVESYPSADGRPGARELERSGVLIRFWRRLDDETEMYAVRK